MSLRGTLLGLVCSWSAQDGQAHINTENACRRNEQASDSLRGMKSRPTESEPTGWPKRPPFQEGQVEKERVWQLNNLIGKRKDKK